MPVVAYNGPNVSTANGVATVFGYTFRILEGSDLYVSVNGIAKTLGVDYTVSGVGDAGGGNVTFGVAPGNGLQVVRARLRPYKRDTDYQRNGAFDEQTVDADFDSLAMQIQQLDAASERGFKAPLSVAAEQVLTEAMWAARANTVLGFDGAGLFGVFAASNINLSLISAFVATLVDDPDSDTFLQTVIASLSAEAAVAIDDRVPIGDTSEGKGNYATVENLLKALAGVGAAEATPAVDDKLFIRDESEGALNQMRFDDFLKVINSLTTDAAPDIGADFGAHYDVSAGAAKKVLWNDVNNWRKLASGSVSNAASLDIVLSSYTGYKTLVLKLERWLPANDDVELWLRTSTDGGSTFDSGASTYRHAYQQTANATAGVNGSSAATKIVIAGATGAARGQGNAATEELMAYIYIGERTNVAAYKNFHGLVTFGDANATSDQSIGEFGGARVSTGDVDAIRLLYESGNIAAGDWTLYGVRD